MKVCCCPQQTWGVLNDWDNCFMTKLFSCYSFIQPPSCTQSVKPCTRLLELQSQTLKGFSISTHVLCLSPAPFVHCVFINIFPWLHMLVVHAQCPFPVWKAPTLNGMEYRWIWIKVLIQKDPSYFWLASKLVSCGWEWMLCLCWIQRNVW